MNIAEGAARRTDKDFIYFLHISLGSASELDTQVEIAARIGLLDEKNACKTQSETGEISRMIYGLIRSVENKKHD
ncbi:four helix bundle protein [Mariprofundus sp. EBB-1]|uniref:four helix bundle protein n=1 Tax=Mariprofundus sp. EBB-1 TaxID=2650971 RepID=UPI001F3D68A5|nr:four helix bundle protein [Mariprofundus sp. EBB-1]